MGGEEVGEEGGGVMQGMYCCRGAVVKGVEHISTNL